MRLFPLFFLDDLIELFVGVAAEMTLGLEEDPNWSGSVEGVMIDLLGKEEKRTSLWLLFYDSYLMTFCSTFFLHVMAMRYSFITVCFLMKLFMWECLIPMEIFVSFESAINASLDGKSNI